MAFRVSQDELGRQLDPIAGSVRSSGAEVYDDGMRPEPWQERPWADKQEIAASQTLQLMAIPGEQIAQIRPPVPYVLFPDQELGFINEPMTIFDVLDTDRWSPMRRSWLSPTVGPATRAEYQATAWSGTARGISQPINPML